MKVVQPILSLILLLGFNQQLFAGHTETGIDLRDECNAVSKSVESLTRLEGYKAVSCEGFVHGVVDAWVLAGKQSCVPDQVTYSEEALVVHKYLEDHPEELHYQPVVLVIRAMNHAWPCR